MTASYGEVAPRGPSPRLPMTPRGDRVARWRLLPLMLVLAVAGSACTVNQALRRGQVAERERNYDEAVVAYTRAVQDNPRDRDAQLSLERARLRAAQTHYTAGRRWAQRGQWEAALEEYQIAYDLNPGIANLEAELRKMQDAVRDQLNAREAGRTELETLIDRTRDAGPPGLELPQDIALPDSVVFRNASSRAIFSALGQFADINVLFDPQFREVPISIDLRNTTFDVALESLATTTQNFFRVTAPRTVTIIPDTPAKRREYEEEIVRTFYLSHADVAETIDLLRLVVDIRRLAPVNATNAISIKDTPERIEAAGRLLEAIDKARAEVVIEVQLLEADRQSLREYGIQFANAGVPGFDLAAAFDAESLTIDEIQRLSGSDLFVAQLPSLFMRLLENDTRTRTLANPHLRTADGVEATASFGERVPVPVSQFLPFAGGGVGQQPITSFNYENVGVNITITPRIHHNDEVSLIVDMQVSNISGTGFNDLPQFGNREIVTTIRLRDGETNILAGLIRDDEREVLDGLPGFNQIPVLGRIFGRNRLETQETDIILTLTPHIIRGMQLEENDLLPFRVGRDAGSPTAGAVAPVAAPPQQIQAQPRAPAPETGIQPILPPPSPPE